MPVRIWGNLGLNWQFSALACDERTFAEQPVPFARSIIISDRARCSMRHQPLPTYTTRYRPVEVESSEPRRPTLVTLTNFTLNLNPLALPGPSRVGTESFGAKCKSGGGGHRKGASQWLARRGERRVERHCAFAFWL